MNRARLITFTATLIVVIAAATSTAACSQADQEGPTSVPATLLQVTDGDTIRVRLAGGAEERVRYIGIDCPEKDHPDPAVREMASLATEHNRALLRSGPLTLELDVQERDTHGRLLAYVYTGEVFVNERLVWDGYALARSYPPNLRRQPQLTAAERHARATSAGLWALGTIPP